MQIVQAQFAVETKNGVVQRVGESTIYQPKTECKGDKGIKWYKDKLKKKSI